MKRFIVWGVLVAITWDAPRGHVEGYNVYRGPDAAHMKLIRTVPSICTRLDYTINDNRKERFGVTAYNQAGESEMVLSEPVQASILEKQRKKKKK